MPGEPVGAVLAYASRRRNNSELEAYCPSCILVFKYLGMRPAYCPYCGRRLRTRLHPARKRRLEKKGLILE